MWGPGGHGVRYWTSMLKTSGLKPTRSSAKLSACLSCPHLCKNFTNVRNIRFL